MANTHICGECALYYALVRPHRDGKGNTDTKKGHCLDRTVYAKGKAGNPVYPAKAKVADLPHNRHKITLVRENAVLPNCTAFTARKG